MFLKNSYEYGVKSEQLAVEYFESSGFEVLTQRYKTKYGEIDLVVSKNCELIFVEVKARKKITPLENIITKKQLSRNYSAAEMFLSEFEQYKEHRCRFDLIIVFGSKISKHIKNIHLE